MGSATARVGGATAQVRAAVAPIGDRVARVGEAVARIGAMVTRVGGGAKELSLEMEIKLGLLINGQTIPSIRQLYLRRSRRGTTGSNARLLELDCIPAGMELFPASSLDQWTLIQSIIDDCDYYIVIVGGRYGSIGPEGLSYTEMEYRYAVEQNKPVMAFLHSTPEELSAKRTEQSEDLRQKLDQFRATLKQ